MLHQGILHKQQEQRGQKIIEAPVPIPVTWQSSRPIRRRCPATETQEEKEEEKSFRFTGKTGKDVQDSHAITMPYQIFAPWPMQSTQCIIAGILQYLLYYFDKAIQCIMAGIVLDNH